MRHGKKLPVLRPWFVPPSCYFIASWLAEFAASMSFHWKMQNVKLLVCPAPPGHIC
jgi:hypothetical protein